MARSSLKISDAQLRASLAQTMARGALSLADACRVLRACKGWTQQQLAAKARVALKVVKQIESGRGNPTLDSLRRVAALAGLEVGFFRPTATVRIGALDGYAKRRAAARRSQIRALKDGKTTLRRLHEQNALRGSDFTIELPELA